MQNDPKPNSTAARASTKTCGECARLWKEYFEVDKKFLKAACERMPTLSKAFDPRAEAEYQNAGLLRQTARKAIADHRALHNLPPAPHVENGKLKALLAEAGAL